MEPMEERNFPGGIYAPEISPDSRYLLYHYRTADGPRARIRTVPPPLPPGATGPEWLLQLATMIAGKEVNDAENSVAVPAARLQIETVRRALANETPTDPYVEWGRWLLDDSPDRPIAPGFTISVAEAGR